MEAKTLMKNQSRSDILFVRVEHVFKTKKKQDKKKAYSIEKMRNTNQKQCNLI